MNRRELLSAGLSTATLLVSPAILQAQERKTLKFVPIADLAIVDPIVTSSVTTRCHAYLVFDTLYGLDKNDQAAPQMLEGHVVEEDGKSWTLTLREGLRFHDGEQVLARDAVSSLSAGAGATPMAGRCSRLSTKSRRSMIAGCASG